MTTDTVFGELQYSRDKGTVLYDHRRYLRPEAVSAARPLTLKLPQAIWLLLDGTFACCQQAVNCQSVPTDQFLRPFGSKRHKVERPIQYLYCIGSVRSVLTDSLRQRQWVVVPSHILPSHP